MKMKKWEWQEEKVIVIGHADYSDQVMIEMNHGEGG